MRSSTLRRTCAVVLLLAGLGGCSGARRGAPDARPHLLFAYFTGNGEDGLHLAHSRDGLRWRPLRGGASFLTPRVGESRLMRDPSVVRGPDGRYRMVWTPGWTERGIGYATSPDLVRWSEQRYLPVMAHEPAARNAWAPEVFYDAATARYLIVWSSTVPGRFPDTDGQDAAPGTPGWNHRIYATTTEDFERFTPTTLLYEPGFNVIDAVIVRDGARYAMLVKDETNAPFPPQKNVRVAFAAHAEGPYGPPSAPITGAYWAEGPTVVRVGNLWHLYVDRYREGRWALLVSSDLERWEDRSAALDVPAGARHGTVFVVPPATAERLLRHDRPPTAVPPRAP